MMQAEYNITVRNEAGEFIPARILYIDAYGDVLGEAWLRHPENVVYQYDIPPTAAAYRFEADGYNWYGTSTLYDFNTITLVKKTNPTALVLIGAVALWLVSRFIKL